MHELSVCQALIRQAEAVAVAHHAARVTCITLRLGPLAGVDAQLLARAFPAARLGTRLGQADLVVEHAPLRVRCDACGHEDTATPNHLACRQCRSTRTQLLSGDELLLVSVDLAGARTPVADDGC
jgi:hydrogenase nickel incorporation protein HypA/HybF